MVGESEFQMAALKDIPWGTNLAALTADLRAVSTVAKRADKLVGKQAVRWAALLVVLTAGLKAEQMAGQ